MTTALGACALRANNERKGVQNPFFKKSMDSV